LASASGYDQVSSAIATANEEGEEGNALWEEAAKRFGTTASEIQILVNSFNDLLISMGQWVLPAVKGFVDFLTTVVQGIGAMDDGLKKLGIGIGIAIVAFGLFSARTRRLATDLALAQTQAAGVTRAVKGLRIATATFSALNLALFVAAGFFANAALNAGKAAKKTAEFRREAKNLVDALEEGEDPIQAWIDALGGDEGIPDDVRRALLGVGLLVDDLVGAFADPENTKAVADFVSEIQGELDALNAFLEERALADGLVRVPGVSLSEDLRQQGFDALANDAANYERILAFVNEKTELHTLTLEEQQLRREELLARQRKTLREFFQEYGGRTAEGTEEVEKHWRDHLEERFATNEKLEDAYADWLSSLDDAIGDYYESLTELRDETRDGLVEAIDPWNEYEGAVKIKVGKVLKSLEKQAAATKAWAELQARLIREGVNPAVVQMFADLDLATRHGITKLSEVDLDKLVAGFEETYGVNGPIAEGFDTLWSEILPGAQTAGVNELVATMLEEGDKLVEAGVDPFETIVVMASDALDRLPTALHGKLLRALTESMTLEETRALFEVLGIEIDKGIAAGIIEDKWRIENAIDQVTGTASRRASSNWIIDSPSKLFAEMGRNLVRGVDVGIRDELAKSTGIDALTNEFSFAGSRNPFTPMTAAATQNTTTSRTVHLHQTVEATDDLANQTKEGLLMAGITEEVEFAGITSLRGG
jgi:hypothetical protein